MPSDKNKERVKELTEKLQKAKSIVFADITGLKAIQADELRSKLRAEGAEVEVAKNTLLKVAMKEGGVNFSRVEKFFEGSTAAVLTYTDPISPIKKLFEFIKVSSLPKVKLGFLDGIFITGEQFETLSKLPSREQLVARVLSGFNSPVLGFVNVLSAGKRSLVNVLYSIKEKKGV